MMKKTLLTLLMIGVLTQLFAQFDTTKVGTFSLYASGDFIDINQYDSKIGGGLELEYRASKLVSFQFPLSISKDYFHFGLGTFLAPIGLAMLKSEDATIGQFFGGILLASTMIESGAFHIPIDRFKEITPYYSLLRLRSMVDETTTTGTAVYGSFSLGVKIRYEMLPRWTINGYAEYTQLYYNSKARGIQSGITLGYNFRKR